MKTSSVAVLSGFASLAAAQYGQSGNNATTSACPAPGTAHFIVARASLEQVGYGVIGLVKDNVIAAVPGSNAEFVEYPATLNAYVQSETAGVVGMRELVKNFHANCPDFPIVLMGYSQGAQVSADTVAGQYDAAFQPVNTTDGLNLPLSTEILSQIAAVVIMGDPSFNTTETFHVGNATKHGLFVRQNVENFGLTNIADRTKSYCDEGDPYCAGGSFSTISVHLGYVNEYGAQAGNFTVSQIKAWYAAHGGKNSTVPAGTASSTKKIPSGTASASIKKSSGHASATGTGAAATKTGATKTGTGAVGTAPTATKTGTGSNPTGTGVAPYKGAAAVVQGMGAAVFLGALAAFVL